MTTHVKTLIPGCFQLQHLHKNVRDIHCNWLIPSFELQDLQLGIIAFSFTQNAMKDIFLSYACDHFWSQMLNRYVSIDAFRFISISDRLGQM